MDATQEEWRPVVGFKGYEISSLGRVRSFRQSPEGRIMRPNRITNGYLQVELRGENGARKGKLVHRLVLEAFIGPPPSDGLQACHNDGNQLNNRLDNLRWDTPAENTRDVFRHGKHFQSNKTECPQGHRYSESNTYQRRDGGRGCIQCRLAATRRWRARNKCV